MTFTNIAIFGGTGNIGCPITRAILTQKLNTKEFSTVLVFTRTGGPDAKRMLLKEYTDHGATVAEVGDFSDSANVAKILKEHDIQVVISAWSGMDLGGQKPIIDAASSAGVKRFYPSEYGGDYYLFPKFLDNHPVFQGKKAIVDYILSKKNLVPVLGMTGLFAEWLISPFYKADQETHTIEIIGTGDEKFGTWTMKEVGDVITESINHPKYAASTPDKPIFIRANGVATSWNEVLATHEKVFGGKWTKTFVPVSSITDMSDLGVALRVSLAQGLGYVGADLNEASALKTGAVPVTFEVMYTAWKQGSK
jgi:nucleoside-diphosphate-sugar epimerase